MLNNLKINAALAAAQATNTAQPSAATAQYDITQWNNLIDEASKAFGVDRNLIAAVIAQESGGNPNAVSPAGAKGLMQLMDSTARDMGVSQVFQPRSNIFGGTKYLKQLLDQFGDEKLALASYNAGPAAVTKYGGIPPYAETITYVDGVLATRNHLVNQSGSPAKEDSHASGN